MRFGITGGIGSGKTFVSKLLEEQGYTVYNCDNEAKRLMVEDPELMEAIKHTIGNNAYNEDGSLNKQVVAAFIFSDAKNTQIVNSLVHPTVKKDFEGWAKSKDICFMESAILFESGFDSLVDKVVYVFADKDVRLERAMKRDDADRSQIEARMDKQTPFENVRSRVDYILDNNVEHNTEKEINKLINYIKELC